MGRKGFARACWLLDLCAFMIDLSMSCCKMRPRSRLALEDAPVPLKTPGVHLRSSWSCHEGACDWRDIWQRWLFRDLARLITSPVNLTSPDKAHGYCISRNSARNASTIQFLDRFCVHNRRFASAQIMLLNRFKRHAGAIPWCPTWSQVSTHKNYYTGEKPDMRSNPGMIADSTRLKRMLMEKWGRSAKPQNWGQMGAKQSCPFSLHFWQCRCRHQWVSDSSGRA